MNKLLKKKYLKRYLIILSISTTLFLGCEKDGISESEFEIQFYRETQLKNIYDNEIVSLTSQFIIETSKLKDLSEMFKDQTNLSNLEAIQTQWIQMLKVWKLLELYDVGEISDSFIYFRINSWPSNTDFINDFIDGSSPIDEAFIASIGSSSKGISGMEYLLFSDTSFESLERFTTATNASRRLNYLVSCSQNLYAMSQTVEILWQNYEPQFISLLENGTDGSQNEIINAMVGLIEQIIISKLGKPLGDNTGGIVSLEELEAYRSGTSLIILEQHLISLERCFTGDFAQTPFRVGFKKYLVQLGYEELSNSILEQFETCTNSINAIESNSLKFALENNKESVTNLRNNFRDLLVLIKVDMSNSIGSTITFNDNDGD